MKNIKKILLPIASIAILVIGALGIVGIARAQVQPTINVGAALRVLRPAEGGTGVGTASGADVGKCLTVSTNSPFTYSLSSCSGGSGSGVGTSTNPFMATYFVATSTTATSTFSGPISSGGWTLSTSTAIEVCKYPDFCMYQVSPMSTSTNVQINTALLAASTMKTTMFLKGYGTTSPYIINDVVQLPSNVNFTGDGIDKTVIKSDVGYNPATSVYGTGGRRVMMIGYNSAPIYNANVQGITFDANVQNISGLASDSTHRTVWIQYANNVSVTNSKFLDGINWTLYFYISNTVHLDHNIVLGGYSSTYNQNDGIHVRNTQNLWIDHNYVDEYAGGGTSGDDGIAVGSDHSGTQDTSNVHISDNTVSGRNGIRILQEGAYAVKNVTVEHNIVPYALHRGIILYKYLPSSNVMSDITLDGNTLYSYGNDTVGTNTDDGIEVDNDFPVASFATSTVYKNLKIINNTLNNESSTGTDSTEWGIDVRAMGQGLTINSNKMYLYNTSGAGCIRVGGTSRPVKDVTAVGNTCYAPVTTTNFIGMEFFGNERGTIANNLLYGNTTGTTYGMYFAAANTAGSDSDGNAFAEVSSNNNVLGNEVYNFDNGIAEINAGANPNNNNFSSNQFGSVTTPYTILGASSGFTSQIGPNFGIGTSTPGSPLSIGNTGGINFYPTATSTFGSSANGINLTQGCFAIAGACLGGSSFSNTLANGGTATTTFSNGGIVFSDSSKLTQDTPNLFWDDTNNAVGLATTSPYGRLAVAYDQSSNPIINVGTGINGTDYAMSMAGGRAMLGYDSGLGNLVLNGGGLKGIAMYVNGTNNSFVSGTSALNIRADSGGPGNVGVGSTTPWAQLSVQPNGVLGPEFAIGSSTTTHFLVDTVGDVGIGTTTPFGRLAINYDQTATPLITLGTGASASVFGIAMANGRGMMGYDSTNNSLNIEAGSLKGLGFYTAGTSNTFATGGIPKLFISGGTAGFGTAGFIGVASSTPYGLFSINPNGIGSGPEFVIGSTTTTHLVVDGAGRLGLGTTTPWRTLSVVGTVAINGLTTATGKNAVCIDSVTKEVVDAGSPTSCTASSKYLKDITGDISPEVAEYIVNRMKGITFNYKGETDQHYGFIAEEVAKIDQEVADKFGVYAHLATYATEDFTNTQTGHVFKKGDPYAVDYAMYTAVLTVYLQNQKPVSQNNSPEKFVLIVVVGWLAFLTMRKKQ